MLIIGPALTNVGRKNIPGFCYKIEAEFLSSNRAVASGSTPKTRRVDQCT